MNLQSTVVELKRLDDVDTFNEIEETHISMLVDLETEYQTIKLAIQHAQQSANASKIKLIVRGKL